MSRRQRPGARAYQHLAGEENSAPQPLGRDRIRLRDQRGKMRAVVGLGHVKLDHETIDNYVEQPRMAA